jgi:hypothetical protein
MGYVTGEVSAADAAAIDAQLAAAARSLGAEDPRTDQQRRADLFADLLLGRIACDHPETESADRHDPDSPDDAALVTDWLEVEDIDPDTGELLSTHLQPSTPTDTRQGNQLMRRRTRHLVNRPPSSSGPGPTASASSYRWPACSAPATHPQNSPTDPA